jgi:TonB family protein
MENKLVKLIFLALALALALALSSSYVSAVEISKHLTTITEPVPITRINPKYPIKAAREGRSGWAKYSFVIEKNGRVSNIVEIDSSGSKDISKAGLKALKKWQYQPAMENGQPIQQCVNTVQLDFQMSKTKGGVRKRFRRKYELALKALKEEEYVRLEELILEMKKIPYRYTSENNSLHTLSAEYAEVIGDKKKQLQHLSSISFLNSERLNKYKLAVLHERFFLAASLNRFQSAYRVYNQLKTMDEAKPYIGDYEKVIAKIDTMIGSELDIVIDANISDKDFWHYTLVRNEFSLANIEGSLNKLDIRCANKRHVYSVENNNTWTIPKAWKNCSILVYGDDDTSFKLIEHPIKA